MSASSATGAVPPVPSLGVLLLARDGLVIEGDAAAARILGAHPDQDVRAIRLPSRLGGEQRESFEQLLERVFGGGAGALELALFGLDGECRSVEAHATPHRDQGGEVRAAQVSLLVTERGRADDGPGDASPEFRTLAENIAENVILYDRQCRPRYVNSSMRATVAADILPVPNVTPAEQAPAVPLALQMQRILEEVVASGQPNDRQVAVRDPSGELRTHHVRCVAARGPGGEVVGVVSIGREITGRERAPDESVRAPDDSVRKLSLAVEQSPASIVITDTAGRIEYVNAKFTDVTGYAAAEAIGQNPRILKSGEMPPQVYREMWQAITAGKVWRGELHNRRKDGELFWELASISPVFDATGAITHYLAVKEDITERKRLEEGLRQAQKMDAIGRLAGGVAHDFNNLLTVIQGGAVALRDGGLVQEQGSELLDQISEAAERAARLTRQLLTFSQRRPAQLVDLDLNDVARGMSRMLRRLIGEQITLVEQYAPDGAPVHADPGTMEQVLLNLAVNARDAMPDGGQLSIRTEVVTEPGQAGRPPVGQVLLTVSDTGTGIAPEHEPHLFEPFFTTKEVDKGIGLGLAVVFGVVKQHGGRIDVQSELGVGTTFRIWLPLLERAVPPLERPVAAPAPGGSETVLVVEDEPSLRRVFQRILEQAGYRVHVAGSAVAALSVWKEHGGRIDLLLTDLVMPGMGGRELAERLRAEDPSLRVLYTSGYSADALGGAALPGVLEKPYGPAELLARVRARLDEG